MKSILPIILLAVLASCKNGVDKEPKAPIILEFKLEGFESAHAVIDPNKRTIQLVLPYQTPLRSLKPIIRHR